MRKILSLILGLLWASPAFALPTGYTELEYIESTGTQYIDTGYFFTDIATETVTLDFMRTGTGAGSLLYGTRKAYKDNGYAIQFQDGGNTYMQYGEIDTGIGDSAPGALNTRYTLIQTGPTYSFRDASYTSTGATPTQSYPLYLFTTNNGGNPSALTPMRVYSFVIKDRNNSIKLHLVPAKNSSGVVGMYDTVGNRFYTNAGTGEFIAGDPVVDNSCRNLFDKDTADANRIYGFFQQTGTSWTWAQNGFSVRIPCKPNTTYTARYNGNDTQVVLGFGSTNNDDIPPSGTSVSVTQGIRQNNPTINTPVTLTTGPNDKWLIVAYNVAEPQHSDMANNLQIEEGDTATAYVPYCEKIKIATTKYNESAFGPLNTALANAISVVDTVVSNTITQAGRIATLQAQKQTRPNDIADDNEKCPAGKKCLLVEDASGVPHWYEIVERYSRLPDGYTELEYLTSGTDGQYIDTGILFDPTKNFRVVGNFINPDTLRKVILGNYYSQQSETYYSIELYSDGKFRNYMSADGGSAFNIYSPTAVPADTMAYFDTSYNALAHQTTTTLRYGTTEQTYSGATPETTTVAVHTLKLFNDKRNLSPVYNNPVSIGAVQIYIDDILAHHYVPARRESDNVLGMYDTVSGQFFTNQGEGSFIAGNPVSE